MSWSTLVEEGSGLNDDSHSNLKRFESEEAVLHGLRSSYNAAMSEVGSNSVGSPLWIRAMDLLKKVSIDCCSCMERIPSAAMQLQEISYLAKRNRVQGLSKDPNTEHSLCYSLILETLSIMMELGKDDISLVLLAARFAKQMNDTWTYKQLILFHQSSMPYLYKDLILADFEASMGRLSADSNCVDNGMMLLKAEDRSAVDVLPAASLLDEGAMDEFVCFVAQKVALGPELSKYTAFHDFNLSWLASSGSDAGEKLNKQTSSNKEVVEEVVMEEEQSDVSAAGSDASDSDGDNSGDDVESPVDGPQTGDNDVAAEEMDVENEADAAGVGPVASAPEPADPVDADGPGRSRRSGRATKKTDPSAWEEDRALRAALEASKAMSRAPSQTQLSRGTSGSEEASNVADMKVSIHYILLSCAMGGRLTINVLIYRNC